MATVYKTPGVYVEEISLFPPSIAQVETAVPAFIGYTRFAQDRGQSLHLVPTRVSSLVEFEQLFGGAPDITVDSITLDNDNNVSDVKLKDGFLLYDSLRLFFANGGSKCYIISIGAIPAAAIDAKEEDFTAGLTVLAKEDEPTLILFPDAVLLTNDKLYSLQQTALEQCAKLGDRFAILDLYPKSSALPDLDDIVQDFRDKVGIRNLHYGAAYTPYLRTNLSKTITYRQVKSELERGGVALDLSSLAPADVIKALDQLDNAVSDVDELNKLLPAVPANPDASVADRLAQLETDFLAAENTFKATPNATNYAALLKVAFDYVKALANAPAKNTGNVLSFHAPGPDETKQNYVLDDIRASTLSGIFYATAKGLVALGFHAGRVAEDAQAEEIRLNVVNKAALDAGHWGSFADADLGSAGDYYPTDTTGLTDAAALNDARVANMREGAVGAGALFKAFVAEFDRLLDAAAAYESTYEQAVVAVFPLLKTIIDQAKNAVTAVPPSGAIAGVYASVDAARGVHKAPANVSLNSVIGVTDLISHDDQQDLNVDVVAGKSINAIRPFTGKGILVWGARTLAGNDNEWRYVSVRRFFNMVEESSKKGTERFVFEPNDANTWTKVKTMIENFLINQWRAGALAGSTPDKAFFVKVGLGQTMTPQDVLEGLMIVEIGLAAVRPAEFIILRFSHKLQEA
jgi:phage tail sheath protein FI